MTEKQIKNKGEIIIYETSKKEADLRVRLENESVWLNQSQIVRLFDKDQSVISRHIKNIFKDNEVDEKSNMQKMHIANSDKPVVFYGLDIILAVGYRTNSKNAIKFRKWATRVLHDYIIKGYIINKKEIAKNYDKFIQTVEDIKQLLPSDKNVDNVSILELVKVFADTWFSLDAFDRDELKIEKVTKRKVKLTADELGEAIVGFKVELLRKKEATDLFAKEKKRESLDGIIGSVMQGFGGKDVYPGIEEKAAHLLYFMVKNHPFVDGNKRSGAYAFVWFLKRVKLLDEKSLTPAALTAITLLIAESKPKDKDKMTALVVRLLRND